jgi:hypothetical protein
MARVVTGSTMIWRKSTFCSDCACVEVAFEGDVVAVRDGKNPGLPVLRFTRHEWDPFIRGVKDGEFGA